MQACVDAMCKTILSGAAKVGHVYVKWVYKITRQLAHGVAPTLQCGIVHGARCLSPLARILYLTLSALEIVKWGLKLCHPKALQLLYIVCLQTL